MDTPAAIRTIYRYPVKGLSAEALAAAASGFAGCATGIAAFLRVNKSTSITGS